MMGSPTAQVVVFALSLIAIVAALRSRFHPFFALTVMAAAFGLFAGLSVGQVAKGFGDGFSQSLYQLGLVIVAAAIIFGIAERAGINAASGVARKFHGNEWSVGAIGLIAGICASPAAALTLLSPLLPDARSTRERNSTCLALAIAAGHGLIWLSPVPIATASILGAGWREMALLGAPIAIASAAVGVFWARWCVPGQSTYADDRKSADTSATALIAACVVPLLLLMLQSVGDMPGEPFGGGTRRELVLAIGRPLILALAGVGVMVLGNWRLSMKCLSDKPWTGRILGSTAGIILTIGAAGGLQRLCQQTGMAELLGERVSVWHISRAAGILIPFLVAATIKTLQGSSLVAAITTAGMMQPLLTSLGLAGESGSAFAALAVGAGTLAVSHVNDEFFWVMSYFSDVTPTRTLQTFSFGALLQGCTAALLLAILFCCLR